MRSAGDQEEQREPGLDKAVKMDRQSQQENREKVLTERSTEADEPLSEEQAEGSVQHSHGEIWPRSESIETRKRILGSEQARATLELGVRTLPDKFALLRAMKVGSLFTGAGSVERVARIMGNECTFGAEIEPWKREWAAKEYNIHMFDDVYNIRACENTECDIAVSPVPVGVPRRASTRNTVPERATTIRPFSHCMERYECGFVFDRKLRPSEKFHGAQSISTQSVVPVGARTMQHFGRPIAGY